jgi:glycosyltransferase involved in cell wall biosynthesis
MRVALDVNGLYTGQAGVARYLRGLSRGLARIEHPGIAVEPIAWRVENYAYGQPARALKTFYREFVWAGAVAPRLLRRGGFDLLHCDSGLIPNTLFEPQVVTLHDLAVFRYPGRFRTWQLRATRFRLRRIRNARRIICDSRFTADEARAVLGIPHERMEVVHLGVDAMDVPAESGVSGAPATDPGPLPASFFLFVGSLEPGKNLALLRDAYQLAESKGVALPPLLIVGTRWRGVPREVPPPPAWGWRFLGRQPDAVLGALYGLAEALLFPSRYEGFGFPVLEAMRAGCPVICGHVASLPEVAGDAACYADLDPTAFLGAMARRLAGEPPRDEITARGRLQAARFTWERCASETVEVYRSALRAG